MAAVAQLSTFDEELYKVGSVLRRAAQRRAGRR